MYGIFALLLWIAALTNDSVAFLPKDDTTLILGAFLFAILSIGESIKKR